MNRLYLCLRHVHRYPLFRDKLAYAFAGILMMVALHLLDGSREEGRGEERCQHILDIVETYARISGTGKGGDGDDDDDSDDDDGDGEDLCGRTITKA